MCICMQKINFIPDFFFFFEILQRYTDFLFWELWECSIIPIKIRVLIFRKPSCFSACKKSTSSFTSFLRYCKEMANLLFQVIWTCMATYTLNDSINLKKPLMFICRQKINFILHIFLKLLERYCKLVILGPLHMASYAHPK